MGRHALVPAELTAGPFTLTEALRAGLDRWHLEGASWRRMEPGVFPWAGLPDTPELKIQAARLRPPAVATFSGRTAAWLHGLEDVLCEPIDVTIPKVIGVGTRNGIVIRRAALAPDEIVIAGGMRATSVVRTLRDLCSRLSVTEAVVVANTALFNRRVTLAKLNALCLARAGCVGVTNLRRVVDLAEPAAESPMESRLRMLLVRMLLVLDGLPRPRAQVALKDSQGRFIGRPDLYYPEHSFALPRAMSSTAPTR
jgi:hypothetical protein